MSFEERLEQHRLAAEERVEQLRAQAEEIAEQLAEAERLLTRLSIGGEVYQMVMAEVDPADGVADLVPPVSGSPVGMLLIPHRTADSQVSELPVDYRDVLEILARAGGPLRAKDVAAAVGLGESTTKAEGMRSKLNRLDRRGWATKTPDGRFTLEPEVRAQVNAAR